jgi:CheY-like chemotaxis protein
VRKTARGRQPLPEQAFLTLPSDRQEATRLYGSHDILGDIPGEEVLTRLQLNEVTRDIPVVVLSADATRDREPLLEAGARAFLTKPIAVRRLLETLDGFFDEPA